MTATLGRLVLYTHDAARQAEFYTRYFGYAPRHHPGDRIVELRPPGDGLTLLLHQAAKGQKAGQAQVKLVFDVADVAGFLARAKEQGLVFGPMHAGDGYSFANAKDPAGNSISVSSRAFAG
jgi:predicted enzyme related to lactoylglutathione lyase